MLKRQQWSCFLWELTPNTALTLLLLGTGGLLGMLAGFKIPRTGPGGGSRYTALTRLCATIKIPSSSLPFTSSAPVFILIRLSASADFLCSSRTFGRSLLLVNLSPPLLTIHEKMCLWLLFRKIFLKRAKLCPTWRGQVSLLLQGGALVLN